MIPLAQFLKRTPLYQTHTDLKARIVPFAGWEMPIQYSGILAETRAVRSRAGLFDVSHMGRLYISGPRDHLLMDWVLTARASDLRQGGARYAMLCNEEGGVIDDTVFYKLGGSGEQHGSDLPGLIPASYYLLVCNAANRQHVLPWLRRWAQEKFPGTSIEDGTEATAMLALQGPSSSAVMDRLCDVAPANIRPFSAIKGNVASKLALISRTGYTGEDGFELIVSAQDAPHVWEALTGEGAVPCGLGARDVLRLEAGLALHGNDIDASTTPLEAGLERFVRLEKEFVGVEALRRQREAGLRRRLVGLAVQGRSIARRGYPIVDAASSPPDAPHRSVGKVTSGTYSPSLDRNIAMGYVLMEFASPGQALQVDIRGNLAEADVVSLPFYSRRRG